MTSRGVTTRSQSGSTSKTELGAKAKPIQSPVDAPARRKKYDEDDDVIEILDHYSPAAVAQSESKVRIFRPLISYQTKWTCFF